MLVKKRVDEELERRKDEIELEVTRRVEAAKQQMEQEMMAELERRRAQAREDERQREVGFGRMGAMCTFSHFPFVLNTPANCVAAGWRLCCDGQQRCNDLSI